MPEPLHSNFQYAQDANGPQSGGYSPTQAELLRQSLRGEATRDIKSYWLQQDQRAQFLSAMVLNNTHGSDALEAYNSGEGRALRQGMGMLVNSPMLAGFDGGNILDLYNGVNTGMLNSGMGFGSVNGSGAYSFGGTGYAQDQIAKQLTRAVQENFFTASGGSRLGETSGMDRTELGQISAYMGLRGGLSGLGDVGDTRHFDSKDDVRAELERVRGLGGEANQDYVRELESLAAMEGDAGGVAFRINDELVKKVNNKIKEGARTLASVKDILGDRGIGELADTAERLTGLDITNVENSRVITDRFRRIKNYAAANGLNSEAVLSEQMQLGSGLREMGMSAPAAGAASEMIQRDSRLAFQSNRATRNALSEQGIYVTETSLEETKMVNSMDVAEMTKSDPRLSAVAYDLQSNTLMSEDQKAEFRHRLSTIGAQVTGDTREERKHSLTQAFESLNEDMQEVGGRSFDTIYDMAGGRQNVFRMVEERQSVEAMARGSQSVSMQRLLDHNLRSAVGNREFGTIFEERDILDDADAAYDISRSLMEFDPSVSRNRMMRSLAQDNPAERFNSILEESSVDDDVKNRLRQQLTSVRGVSVGDDGKLSFTGEGADNALDVFQEFSATVAAAPMLNNYAGQETRDRSAQAYLRERFTSLTGSQNLGKGGFVEAFAEGVFGAEDISTEMAMEHAVLEGRGDSFINVGNLDQGNLFEDLEADELKAVARMADMSGEAIEDKIETDRGKVEVLDALKSGGAHTTVSDTGQMYLAASDNKQVDESRQQLSDHAARAKYARIMGRDKDYAIEGGELTEEGRQEYLKDLSERGEELVHGAHKSLIEEDDHWGISPIGIGKDVYKERFEDLMSLKESDPEAADQMIQSQIAKARKDGDNKYADELTQLQEYVETGRKPLSDTFAALYGDDVMERGGDLVEGAAKSAIEGKDGFLLGKGNLKDLQELQSFTPDLRNDIIDSKIREVEAQGDDKKATKLRALKEHMNMEGSEVSLLTQIRDSLMRIENDD